MLIAVSHHPPLHPPPDESNDNDEAELPKPEENEDDIQQNEEQEIEEMGADLLEQYSDGDVDADDEVSSIQK